MIGGVQDCVSPLFARRRYAICIRISTNHVHLGEVFARILREPWIQENMVKVFPDTKKNDRGLNIEQTIKIILGKTETAYIKIAVLEVSAGEYDYIVESNDHDLAYKVADIIESMTED